MRDSHLPDISSPNGLSLKAPHGDSCGDSPGPVEVGSSAYQLAASLWDLRVRAKQLNLDDRLSITSEMPFPHLWAHRHHSHEPRPSSQNRTSAQERFRRSVLALFHHKLHFCGFLVVHLLRTQRRVSAYGVAIRYLHHRQQGQCLNGVMRIPGTTCANRIVLLKQHDSQP